MNLHSEVFFILSYKENDTRHPEVNEQEHKSQYELEEITYVLQNSSVRCSHREGMVADFQRTNVYRLAA